MPKVFRKPPSGFTLVELLIVVVILGALTGIAIPTFATYQRKACDAKALSDLSYAKITLEGYFTDHRAYP